MSADYVIKGLKQFIEEEAVANEGAGLSVPVYISQEDEIRDYPCIMIKDMGADEHDVLRRKKLINCIYCDSTSVRKSVMAPNLSRGGTGKDSLQ